MKRTEFKKHAAALLLMLCLLAVSALPAFATSANIKLTDRNGDPMTGTIRVRPSWASAPPVRMCMFSCAAAS